MRRSTPLSLTGLLGLLSLWPCAVPLARAVQVELRVEDVAGQLLPARVHLRDAYNQPYPGYADSALMSHVSLGGYFYTPGSVTMDLPPGSTRILVGRGFEWRPVEVRPVLAGDTCIIVRLVKPYDLRSRGWFSGDTHMHSQHPHEDGGSARDPSAGAWGDALPPGEEDAWGRDSYIVPPEGVRLVAQAEDLAQSWCLDDWYEFTGGPHALSTGDTGIYFCTEYRNQAYGHSALLGQRTWQGNWCCPATMPAYPMLYHIWGAWTPDWDEAMTLCHPQTGAGFFDDEGWPGCGLGRELPALAALGRLDVLDVAAYSNDPDVYLDDWYRLLNFGSTVPPSAGTDALLNAYEARPAGGYRVYVKEGPGVPHQHGTWLQGLKAGHCFVTNYPLIPQFAVNGVEAGGCLELPGPAEVQVSLRIECVLPLLSAQIIRDGAPVMQIELPSGQLGTEFETVVTVPVEGSCWLALRVDGATSIKHATSSHLFAHTAAVRIDVAGVPQRSTLAAGHFLDQLDSLWMFVQIRDHWQSPWQQQEVRQRIDEAGAVFATAFIEPPQPCRLLEPAWGDTIHMGEALNFDWTDATDPEPGDRLVYYLEISIEDSTFTDPMVFGPLQQSQHVPLEQMLAYNLPHYWRVITEDRGGNRTTGVPRWMWFYPSGEPSGAGDPHSAASAWDPGRLRVWPSPARDRVWFRTDRAAPGGLWFDVLDTRGGLVAGGACGAASEIHSWDGRDGAGRLVPSGCYWLRVRAAGGRGQGQAIRPVLILR